MKKKSKQQLISAGIVVFVLVIIDQITKQAAALFLKNQPSFPIIKDVFELQYLENTSAAFGLDPILLLHKIFHFEFFQNHPEIFLNVRMGFFYLLTMIIVTGIFYVFYRIPNLKRYRYMDYILIFFAAGALGNFIDRLIYKYVIDFFYFKLINFPIFNIADIYVTCAAFGMILLGIFYYKEEDIDAIFPSSEKSN